VFEKLTGLTCVGSIKSIQTDLFKNFGSLTIQFFLNCLGNFYHQIGIEWINDLGIGSSVALFSQVTVNTYPDRDFCIFANKFPRDRSIELVLDNPGTNGSVLFAWLCKNGGMIMANEDLIFIVSLNTTF
jgi:hypothetical protein